MWIIVLFDLPTDTKKTRKQYSEFRKFLLKDNFSMMQYSVYARNCPSNENAAVHVGRIKNNLPPDGEVRIIKITDKQFAQIEIFYGKKRKFTEKAPKQLEFF